MTLEIFRSASYNSSVFRCGAAVAQGTVNPLVVGSNPTTGAMIIREKTPLNTFGDFIKVVVDIERNILSAGCELHIDCAEELEKDGSQLANLWGANAYSKTKQIDFVSLINFRPAIGNRTMEIENPEIRKKVEVIIQNILFQ